MSAVCLVSSLRSRMPQNGCPNCGFDSWCLPANFTLRESKKFNDRIEHRRSIKRSKFLYHAGAPLESLHVINSGFLKTSMADSDGREQVIGFSMTGELVGLDAIGTGKYLCDSIALEDSSICGIRYSDLVELGHAIPALQHHFHQIMSAEITRDHGIMVLLGIMSAEERVATFLLNLSVRFSARGYSGTCFRLPMTRQDIGSYLGLKLETVCRILSHFNNIRLISINQRVIEIKSILKLRQRIGVHETTYSSTRRTKSSTC